MLAQDYYLNYKKIFFSDELRESDSHPMREKIIIRLQDVFKDYENYLLNNYKEHLKFLDDYADEALQCIQENMSSCIIFGIDLYISVLLNNGRKITGDDMVPVPIENINKHLQDEDLRADIMTKYDVYPIIEELVDVLFYTIVEKYDSIADYSYGEVENFRILLGYIIENSYIMCVTCFEE